MGCGYRNTRCACATGTKYLLSNKGEIAIYCKCNIPNASRRTVFIPRSRMGWVAAACVLLRASQAELAQTLVASWALRNIEKIYKVNVERILQCDDITQNARVLPFIPFKQPTHQAHTTQKCPERQTHKNTYHWVPKFWTN